MAFVEDGRIETWHCQGQQLPSHYFLNLKEVIFQSEGGVDLGKGSVPESKDFACGKLPKLKINYTFYYQKSTLAQRNGLL
ncbi:hypothetical protein V6N11_080052 [Hibiscus sabdariffa]|uniref:Uncharacterized protein n=1 Tax=Hibiscus sabdariffa TaxID=183260 RepID=A0ABR2RXX6_9ROSI